MADPGLLELESFSKFRAIASVAVPACLQNAAGPITTSLQTALLANYAGSTALAAYAAVSVSATFATRVFNFLVDGVSAKVGKSVGQGAWGELAFRVQLSLLWALGAGLVASALLAAAKVPVVQVILELQPDVLQEAEAYWWLRCGLVPVQLLNMAIIGILQGYHQVRVNALLNACQAALELGGSAAVLVWGMPLLGARGLLAMGWVTVITQLLESAAGLACVLLLSPRAAGGGGAPFRLLDAWFPARGGGGGRGSSGDSQRGGWRASLRRGLRGLGGKQGQAPRQAEAGGRSGEMSGVREGGIKEPLLARNTCDSVSSLPLLALASAEKEGEEGSDSEGSPAAASGGSHSGSPALGALLGNMEEGEEGSEVGEVEQQAVAAAEAATRKEHMLDFVKDGLNMLIRSMVIQCNFFASLVAASRHGTASLAAYSIIGQLWIFISYLVDGFAAAGIVLGSRLAAHAHNPLTAATAKRQMQRLVGRVLAAGLVSGIVAGVAFSAFQRQLIDFFTPDPEIEAVLCQGSWLVMVLIQPVNGMVYVYDGLMYASQSFRYIRNMMLLGLALVFAPLMALEATVIHNVWGVWLAMAGVNMWRLCGAAWLIHGRFMREFDCTGGSSRAGERV